MRVFHAYTLSPPEATLLDSVHEQIAHLDLAARRKLLQTYNDEPSLFAPET